MKAMLKNLVIKNKVYLWQITFLLLGSGWLLAPALNTLVSSRTTLISEYEMSFQPYSWLFRLTDTLAAVTFIAAVIYLRHRHRVLAHYQYVVLLIAGACMLIDPLATTTCSGKVIACLKTSGVSFYLHGAESVLLGFLLFGLSAYDSVKRKALPSTVFLVFQVVYALVAVTGASAGNHLNTLTQFTYQLIVILWLAWYMVSFLPPIPPASFKKRVYTRRLFAAWAYVNGMLTILLSLSHIQVVGAIRGLYFANNTAWVAQHGTIVGVAMIYISYHLWRGEHRARLLFLTLLFMEVIKYSVITPHFWLLQLYSLTFAMLFILRSYFHRGSMSLSRRGRLQEAGTVIAGVLSTMLVVFMLVAHDQDLFATVQEAFGDFKGFVLTYEHVPRHLLKSSLLAHTISALVTGTIFFVLWSLFRPSPRHPAHNEETSEDEVLYTLRRAAVSSEDYFKYWPPGKQYHWSANRETFIAYKVVNSVVFALADPIGRNAHARKRLLKSFIDEWSSRGYVVCFLLVPENTRGMYESTGLNTMQIGSNALIDINTFASNTVSKKWWRWQLNRATKAGYAYRCSVPPHDSRLVSQIKEVSDEWLARPGRREQGFAMGYYDEHCIDQSIIHYVENDAGAVIAFTNQLPVYNNLPQTTIDLMRFKPEYDNVMPYLLASTIETLAKQKHFKLFDLGFVPLAKVESQIAKAAKTIGSRRFSAAGLEQFKNKFEPVWQADYIAYDGNIADLATIAVNLEELMKI